MEGPSSLFIIGGAEDHVGAMTVLRELLAMAGGPKAVIGVVPVSSALPKRTLARYQLLWTGLGARTVPLVPKNRRDAEGSRWASLIASCTAVFFTGGDQVRAAKLVVGTRFHRDLHDFLTHGGIIAGTSAGAALMSRHMIFGGVSDHREGLGLWPGAVVDQHFSERARYPRLLASIQRHPECIGIGIDEDTAVRVDLVSRVFSVVGSGTVTVITPCARVGSGDVSEGVTLDLLRHGDVYRSGHLAQLRSPSQGHDA